MKKFTILAALLAVFTMNAQLFSDDFNDNDISDWTLIDADGDGFNFVALDGGSGDITMSSDSWSLVTSGPLTPDNYAVSQPIDVAFATGLSLDYQVGAQDPAYAQEFYTVYVSTGNTIADFENPDITVSFSENIGDDPLAAGALVDRTLDVSPLEGASTVYIAFRHHNSTDQFYINFNDVVLNGVLGTSDTTFENFNYYVANDVLNLSANTSLESVQLYNLLGQQVVSQKLSNSNETINLASFSQGVYIVKVNIEGQTKSFKIIKN